MIGSTMGIMMETTEIEETATEIVTVEKNDHTAPESNFLLSTSPCIPEKILSITNSKNSINSSFTKHTMNIVSSTNIFKSKPSISIIETIHGLLKSMTQSKYTNKNLTRENCVSTKVNSSWTASFHLWKKKTLLSERLC